MSSNKQEISENWNKIKTTNERQFRENCGLIIGTSFSMIILLLSFTEERNAILDLGILNLTISVILLFNLFIRSAENVYYEGETEKFIKDILKFESFNQILSHYGMFFFLIGLVFIFTFFNLMIIGIIIFSFLLLRLSISTISSIK